MYTCCALHCFFFVLLCWFICSIKSFVQEKSFTLKIHRTPLCFSAVTNTPDQGAHTPSRTHHLPQWISICLLPAWRTILKHWISFQPPSIMAVKRELKLLLYREQLEICSPKRARKNVSPNDGRLSKRQLFKITKIILTVSLPLQDMAFFISWSQPWTYPSNRSNNLITYSQIKYGPARWC